jgi:hypothetical protein
MLNKVKYIKQYLWTPFIPLKWIMIFVLLSMVMFSSCNGEGDDSGNGTWVKPSIDYKGKYRKGHYRKKVNTKKDAGMSRARSKYYYDTRGKYRNKKKKD